MTESCYDVIVVGGGISGLYTARCLEKEGLNVLVLEARDRVGGRAWTLRDTGRFQYADMGGAYVGPTQSFIVGLLKELGLQLYTVPKAGDSILQLTNKKTRYSENGLPVANPITLLDLNDVIHKLDTYSLQVPSDCPWNAAKAEEWDKMSLADFLRKECWTKAGQDIIAMAASVVTSSEADVYSLLYFLTLVRRCGGVRALTVSGEGLQSSKIVGGSNTVSETMAEQLGDRVRLRCAVRDIDQSGPTVKVSTQDDQTFQAKQVVVAMCPSVLQHVEFQPPLPPALQCYVDHSPECKAIKTVLYYDKPYWIHKGLRGEFASVIGPGLYGLPDTKSDGSHPAIMSFISYAKYGHLTAHERKRVISQHLASIFGVPQMLNPVDYVEKVWGDEESTLYSGACVYSTPPGFLTKHRSLWGSRHGRVHFTGAEAGRTMTGYMDGAIRAAEATAREVLDALGASPKRFYRVADERLAYLQPPLLERWLPSVVQVFMLAGAIVLGCFFVSYSCLYN